MSKLTWRLASKNDVLSCLKYADLEGTCCLAGACYWRVWLLLAAVFGCCLLLPINVDGGCLYLGRGLPAAELLRKEDKIRVLQVSFASPPTKNRVALRPPWLDPVQSP